MAVREDLVNSAVSFLQDPSVSASPIENRISFLQSKNLTPEEIDVALARAGGDNNASQANYPYAPPQQVARQPPAYGGYQQYPWQQPPPAVPRRDWRDWFIMATVMGGVSYGLYVVAKRYVYPLIAPPTPPQLEADKAAIDASFEKAFALLDQLSKDTETLKASEVARTERLDKALSEVESVIGELKTASRRREEESRRTSDEVRGLKDLIPKAIEGNKEAADLRLKELNSELKSLKTLLGQRMNPPQSTIFGGNNRFPATTPSNPQQGTTTNNTPVNPSPSNESTPKPATVSSGGTTEATASTPGRSETPRPFTTGAPFNRAAIPAWQMAAASKSTPSVTSPTAGSGSSQTETSGAGAS